MKNSTGSLTANKKLYFSAAAVLLLLLSGVSLFSGKLRITPGQLFTDAYSGKLFLTLRVTRTLTALLGGFVLGLSGYVFQTVFRNPLASPDVVGVSSGASAGAAFGILFLHGTGSVILCAFGGGAAAVLLTLFLASLDPGGERNTLVLSGIAVHALFQTALMALKLTADPERQLASVEYWLMGSLSGIRFSELLPSALIMTVASAFSLLLWRQTVLLANDEEEASLLGVPVKGVRVLVLFLSTLSVAALISITGLIGFLGLMAPHIARRLMKTGQKEIMVMSGLTGATLLLLADIPARTLAATELPVSLFLSLLGAPFLILLTVERRKI